MVLRLGGLNNCLFGFAETGAIPEKGMVINMKDIVVIGAGPAGLTAAIYGIRAGYQVTVLEENIYGGQVASTPTVENYPGIESITGVDFSISLYNQATALGAEILFEKLESCDLKGEVKKLQTANGAIEARAVIIANGAKRAKLGCEGEERLTGRGVSYCATCDGAFYKGKEVAIVGGGNTALEDALFLSNNCSAVHLIHRRDQFRGAPILQESVKKRENIVIHYNAVPHAITGENAVEAIVLDSTVGGEGETIPVSGVFVAIGTKPENERYKDQLPLTDGGYFDVGEDCTTPLPGVYVAGDSRRKPLRQIVTATADGAVAATMAAGYLNQQ